MDFTTSDLFYLLGKKAAEIEYLTTALAEVQRQLADSQIRAVETKEPAKGKTKQPDQPVEPQE